MHVIRKLPNLVAKMLFFYPQFASTRPLNWEQNGTHAKKKICLSLCEKNIIVITKTEWETRNSLRVLGWFCFTFCNISASLWSNWWKMDKTAVFFITACLFVQFVHALEFVPLEKVIKRDSPCFSWDQKLSVQCLTKYYSLQAHSIQLPKIISLSLTSSLSWKIFLLSECPMITQLQPMSLIIAGLKWIFNIWLLLQTLDMKYVLSAPI